MSRGHRIFGEILSLYGYYYQTIHIYKHTSSSSIYIEESKHHNDNMSVTNLIDGRHMRMMIDSMSPSHVYTGFAKDHPYRNDVNVGGYWEYSESGFLHLGMEDDDLLMYLTRDTLSS